MRQIATLLTAALLTAVLLGAPAQARTLDVGNGGAFRSFADAAAKAEPGDTIALAAGEYFECATLRAPDLVVQGAGPATVLTDRTCAGKALLIAQGDRLTVRDLVLARARVPDMNGAGIRLEAQGLMLERVRFENDQVGVLAAQDGPGEITVSDCSFHGGGVAGEPPSYALRVGGVSRLVVEHSSFAEVKGGQISSGATTTWLTGNHIATGVEAGAGPAVVASGALLMRDNVVSVGPASPPRNAAIEASGSSAELHGNRLLNSTGGAQTLLLDWTGMRPVLDANTVGPGDTQASSDGVWRHRASGLAHQALGDARAVAGWTKRLLQGMMGR